ncbi:MAG: hypothetical protein ACRCY9_05170 [Phycicoccus sp.]
MSISCTPAASTSTLWAMRDDVVDEPKGKSTTTHIPVSVPAVSGAAISMAVGLMHTVRQPYLTPFATSRAISSWSNSGLRTEWSM